MAFLGLVPSEYSSGDTRRQGSITKAGNSHARWFLVEAAQHYRLAPKVSKELAPRQEKLPARLKEIKGDLDAGDERKVLESYLALSEQEGELGGRGGNTSPPRC